MPRPLVRPERINSPQTQELGRRLRVFREAKGVSQEQLAFETGVNRTYIGNLERGRINPTLYNIMRVAEAVGVDPGELVKGLPPLRLSPPERGA
jgi:transcriptional regulator with XRE-family HTH domain